MTRALFELPQKLHNFSFTNITKFVTACLFCLTREKVEKGDQQKTITDLNLILLSKNKIGAIFSILSDRRATKQN